MLSPDILGVFWTAFWQKWFQTELYFRIMHMQFFDKAMFSHSVISNLCRQIQARLERRNTILTTTNHLFAIGYITNVLIGRYLPISKYFICKFKTMVEDMVISWFNRSLIFFHWNLESFVKRKFKVAISFKIPERVKRTQAGRKMSECCEPFVRRTSQTILGIWTLSVRPNLSFGQSEKCPNVQHL